MDDFYGEFGALAPLLVLRDRLRAAALDTGGLTWMLPDDTLPGVTSAWGIPVVRVPALTEPMLALRA